MQIIRKVPCLRSLVPLLWLDLILAFSVAAQVDERTTTSVYRTPAKVLADIVDAPPTPLVSLSPDNNWLLILELPNLPSIAELSERELRLAGLRIKPQTNGPSRSRPFTGLQLMKLSNLAMHSFAGLPKDARIGGAAWSPNAARLCFTNTTSDGIELWVVEVATGEAKRLIGPHLSLTANAPPVWLPDSQSLVCALVPADRGPEPKADRIPTGPVVQQNLGRMAPARTYQDLLNSSHDEDLFEYYFTSQMAQVDMHGKTTLLGAPCILWDFDPSPDGRFLLVEILHRPFSYLVPASRFPKRVEIWDRDGQPVRQLVDKPLQDEIPIAFGSVATGPRGFQWRSDAGATLSWVEAQDGGDAGAEAEVRDKVYLYPAPFQGKAIELVRLKLRYGGTIWGDSGLALVSSWWWKTRTTRTWIVSPAAPGTDPKILFDRSWEDRYNDPGSPVTKRNAAGRTVLQLTDEGTGLFLIGSGASPEGDRPFLDTRELAGGRTERLFRSAATYFEQPVRILDEQGRYLLTRRESVDQPPNFFVRDLSQPRDGTRQITFFPHPTPQLVGIQKELVRYERSDGVKLTGTLYLPQGYTTDQGPLPLLLWAYPQEFKSASAAGQVTDSPYRFVRVRWSSPLLWVTRGFAVLDDPGMPIVGENEQEPNEKFVEQLVSSAQAAIDEMVRRGVAEPGRIAIGGHSYGAFMTANLLAHSDLFAAGIARSGAYNRTLTPFGFQAEQRTLWEAPDIYFKMSPFMHAEKVNEPILLIHGEADNNSGTFPMQSERFYNALKGLGATVRLVMLPHESHGYRARQSVLHMLWEMDQWLEKYVARSSTKQHNANSTSGSAGG